MQKSVLIYVLQMDTTVLQKEKSPQNNVFQLQNISKDWIMPTAVK